MAQRMLRNASNETAKKKTHYLPIMCKYGNWKVQARAFEVWRHWNFKVSFFFSFLLLKSFHYWPLACAQDNIRVVRSTCVWKDVELKLKAQTAAFVTVSCTISISRMVENLVHCEEAAGLTPTKSKMFFFFLSPSFSLIKYINILVNVTLITNYTL